MKNKKLKKRLSLFGAVLFAFTFMMQGMGALISDVVHSAANAISGNSVYFSQTTAEASNSNIVYVDLIASGQQGDTITVSYKTFSRTAIRNIDFVSVENLVTIKLKSFEEKYTIAIKCLNNTNTREKFRVYDQNQTYGRYFDLKIIDVDNAQVVENKGTCKCYLPYDHKVEATVGITDTYSSREVAYLNDYKTMLMQYDGGTGGLDGGSTRKTWKKAFLLITKQHANGLTHISILVLLMPMAHSSSKQLMMALGHVTVVFPLWRAIDNILKITNENQIDQACICMRKSTHQENALMVKP